MPRNRPPPATVCISTAATASPSRRSAVPTMPAAIRTGPYWPEALIAAIPFTNSISPTGRMASGPSALNIDAHSMNTVDTTLWPLAHPPDLVEQIARGNTCGPKSPTGDRGVTNRQVGLEEGLDRQREPVSIRCRCCHVNTFPYMPGPARQVPALVIGNRGQCSVGCSCPYAGRSRYTPGDPAAWTMCGRISLFHAGDGRAPVVPGLAHARRRSDAISPVTSSGLSQHGLKAPGTDVAEYAGTRAIAHCYMRRCFPSNADGTDIRPTRRPVPSPPTQFLPVHAG